MFNSLRYLIQNIIFDKNLTTTPTLNNIFYGTYDKSLNFLSNGSYFDNFRPGFNVTTGIYPSLQSMEKYTLKTGRTEQKALGQITEFNGIDISNGIMKIYDGNEYCEKIIPFTYNSYHLPQSSEGFQFSFKNAKLYFFESVSSMIFEFKFQTEKVVRGYSCYNYIMTNNFSIYNSFSNTNYGNSFIKFNKPFIISQLDYFKDIANRSNIKFNNKTNISLNEYIENSYASTNSMCIDIYSGYVIYSNITLLYSIKTSNLIFPDWSDDVVIPMFIYTKTHVFNNVSYIL